MPFMTDAVPVLLFTAMLGAATGAEADFTLAGHSTLTAMNLSNTSRETLFVKKNRLRRDRIDRGHAYSYLYDLGEREITVLDHTLRQAEIHTLGNAATANRLAVKDLTLALAPTGRRHALQDWNCEEHTLSAFLPAELGQEKVTLRLAGQVWLERKARQRKELAPFVRAVQADDFFIGAATPGQTAAATQIQGLNEALRRVLGQGMVCAAEIRLDYEGTGPMAELARRMATHTGLVYESVSTSALTDAAFDIPAGYSVVRR